MRRSREGRSKDGFVIIAFLEYSHNASWWHSKEFGGFVYSTFVDSERTNACMEFAQVQYHGASAIKVIFGIWHLVS